MLKIVLIKIVLRPYEVSVEKKLIRKNLSHEITVNFKFIKIVFI